MDTINISLLGAGIFARTAYLPALAKSPRLILKSIYSRSKKSATEAKAVAQAIGPTRGDAIGIHFDADLGSSDAKDGLAEVLSDPTIDAVIIALPIPQQPEVIRRCLEARKHVLSEKPVAATVSEARSLLQFYSSLPLDSTGSRPYWSVAECLRHEPAVAYAAKLVAGLGNLTFFTFTWAHHMSSDNPYFHTSWRSKPGYQGGYLLDGGVHFAAELRSILSRDAESVAAFGRQVKGYLPPIDTISALCKFKDPKEGQSVSGSFTMSAASAAPIQELVVVGDKGVVTVESQIHRHDSTEEIRFSVSHAPAPAVGESAKMTVKEFDSAGVQAALDGFSEAVRGTAQRELLSRLDPTEAMGDLILIEAILKSADNHGEIVHIEGL